MDFKVAGDDEGITAFQMDIKVEGITIDIVKEALAKAKAGRQHILGEMGKCDPPPANKLSDTVPIIESLIVDPKNIGIIIGTKGATINGLIEKYNLQSIDIQDSGVVQVVGKDADDVKQCILHIHGLVDEPETGKIYRDCEVVSVTDFGCFVEILPGKEALCHISELQHERTEKVEDVCKVGDKIDVVVLEDKSRDGKVRVSRKAMLQAEEGEIIRGIVEEPEVGDIYRDREVVRLMEFGCIVEIFPGKEALCHISEMQPQRPQKVEDVCKVGDKMDVMVLEGRTKQGMLRVSRKAVLEAEGGEQIRAIVEEPEVGKIYRGVEVKNVKEYGCFVEIIPGREVLCHISELEPVHTAKVEDVCKVGDKIDVLVLQPLEDGRARVSRKAVLEADAVVEA